MTNKIVISVSGGVVQSVYSDDPELEVLIYDWDDIKASGDSDSLAGLETDMDEAYDAYIAKEQEDYELAIQDMEQVA